jgi:hypothetical protein
MALIRCPDCGNEISALAPSCPHCGRPKEAATPLPQKAQGSNNLRLGCLLLIAIFLFLIYLFFTLSLPNRESKEREVGSPEMAAIMCQGFVKERLTAPSTAKFPNAFGADTKTVTLGRGHYRVTSYVDAQNSFGAQIRTTFVCKVKKIPGGDNWQLENLSM